MYSGRKSRRFKIAAPATICDADGNSVMACTVNDISKTGAGLKIDHDVPLPQSFLLALTRDGSVRRSCELVWQKALVAGVRFNDVEGPEGVERRPKSRAPTAPVQQ